MRLIELALPLKLIYSFIRAQPVTIATRCAPFNAIARQIFFRFRDPFRSPDAGRGGATDAGRESRVKNVPFEK